MNSGAPETPCRRNRNATLPRDRHCYTADHSLPGGEQNNKQREHGGGQTRLEGQSAHHFVPELTARTGNRGIVWTIWNQWNRPKSIQSERFSLFALGVCRNAHDPPKVGDQVRLLARAFDGSALSAGVSGAWRPSKALGWVRFPGGGSWKTPLAGAGRGYGYKIWLGETFRRPSRARAEGQAGSRCGPNHQDNNLSRLLADGCAIPLAKLSPLVGTERFAVHPDRAFRGDRLLG
jgi:hypothetical protein